MGRFKPLRTVWTNMADTLRRLTGTASFRVLQDKLESWDKDYHVSSSITNDRPKSDHSSSSVSLALVISRITKYLQRITQSLSQKTAAGIKLFTLIVNMMNDFVYSSQLTVHLICFFYYFSCRCDMKRFTL